MTEASTDIASQAVSAQNFRTDFDLNRELPEQLKPLADISANFYWSWQPEGVALFRELDPALWEKCEQNPRLLLKTISGLRLWQKAADADYVSRVGKFNDRLRSYLTTDNQQLTTDRIAYFCAEYGVHNSLPNYSGGLGILAGDHLKSASDLGLPLTAVGLLYRYGYFRQNIRHDGWQEEAYHDVFESELALTPVFESRVESQESRDTNHSPRDSRLTVSVHVRGREVVAQAWLARIGRISLYLLDSNVPQNSDVDRLITGHLYGGDTETRIVQEKVLGIGGVRLLRKLGIDPSVFHLNEGHSAFLTLELAREYLGIYADDSFADAAKEVRKKCVFTTHTPVAAGNDVFSPKLLSECFSKKYIESLKLTENEFLALGRVELGDHEEFFGMTPLALRMTRSANGVSAKHGEVSRNLWRKMFEVQSANREQAEACTLNIPITSVTNGVHAPTWVAPAFQTLFEEHIGANWHEAVRNGDAWAKAIDSLPDADIWNTHLTLKNLLVAFIRERTRSKETGTRDTINERENTQNLFSPDILTIGFARRVAAYKRWDLLFSDIERLLKMVDASERPVQFVFAGKAHPQDRTAKSILQELMSINHESNWQKRAVFIEDYDQEVARYLVQGVDVWMNVPRRPMEASGTSGMKAAMNGVLNFSILDGWWIEGFNGENGFAIGELSAKGTDKEMDVADAESLYATLENDVIPAYYSTDENGLRMEWMRRMKNSIATLTPQFSSDRMVGDYLKNIYSV